MTNTLGGEGGGQRKGKNPIDISANWSMKKIFNNCSVKLSGISSDTYLGVQAELVKLGIFHEIEKDNCLILQQGVLLCVKHGSS